MSKSSIDFTTTDQPRASLYSPEFSADPHGAYREMRERYGSLVPIELAPGIPATLVIGYRAGLAILNDPERFPADPRTWEASVPADCPVLPILRWRPNATRATGYAHTRLRDVFTTALDEVDLHAVHDIVERTAIPLINTFCTTGSADLVAAYAFPIVFEVVNELLGCPPSISEKAAAGVLAMLDGVDAQEANRRFEQSLLELVRFKRTTPGADITTGLLRRGTTLTEEEMLNQVLLFYGLGMGPTQSLIINALRLLLTDDGFNGDIVGGSLSTRDALDQVLFEDPPLPNNSVSYPRQPILIDGTWLPAHQPVVVSLAGCNNDPEITSGDHTGNRAHLAWGAGPHACPARTLGYLIAQSAVDQLLDALPELRLAVAADELQWRPGTLHRTLAELPVTFPPSPPLPVP
ncbi:cytochrome P450 [Nocardia barduliensis]|uniref:cytochrome P450 n=1 Tax=Nocardia barduliensis TaxID=2736643 RepID=UPI001C2CDA4B|nr:cytochrome P450 [Nocardia barduliensis]